MQQDPSTIGRYKVLRKLGGGGMGVVYLAEDALLKRQVAIKLVRGGMAENEHAMLRFRREAEISAQLNHPNVIVVYDVGTEPGYGPFIAMEYVAGTDLAELIRTGKLDDAGRVQVLIQAMRALDAAHRAGVVHRDVKPANLLVSDDGRVKLVDFGIARSEDSTLTATGMFLGTPAYMAPELIRGDDASFASDCYALAVVALELFTGRRPFRADTTPALLYKIAHEPPEIAGDLPEPMREVFLRALAKEPSARFADLRSFLSALVESIPLDGTVRVALRGLVQGSDTLDLQRARETLAAAETVAATLADERTEPAAASPARLAAVPQGRPVRGGRGAWILGAGAGVAVAAGVALLLTAAPPPDTDPAARPEPAPTLEMLPRPAPDGATEAAAVRPVPEAAALRPVPEAAATAPPEVIPAALAVPSAAPPAAPLATPAASPGVEPARAARLPASVAPAPSATARQATRRPPRRAAVERGLRGPRRAPPPRRAAPPPEAKPPPAWGAIRPEGAQRLD